MLHVSKVLWCAVICLAVVGIVAAKAAVKINTVYVEYGQNLGATVPKRINLLLSKTGVIVSPYTPEVDKSLTCNSLVLSFGNASLSKQYMPIADVKTEGFRILSQVFATESTLIMSNGQPISSKGHNFAINVDAVHYGAVVGAYAVLEQLRFSFLHPMDPMIPLQLSLPTSDISTTESPYWPTRTWHVHTQHPLEFTEVLNGFDVPMFAKVDDSSATTATTADAQQQAQAQGHSCLPNQYCETWDSMYSKLDGLFEWFAANRQNRVEVLLLGSPKWDVYNDLTSGSKRQQRLQKINALSHEYGVMIGADIPIANRQQHGWKMITLQDNFTQQSLDINNRVDWAFAAEYDFISTESGLSEFTKPSCDLMLSLFQVFTERGEWLIIILLRRFFFR